MAGVSRGQGMPLHRGPRQLRASTNPNKRIAYPRTLYPKEYTLAWNKLYSDLAWTGYFQHGLIPGLYLGLMRSGQIIPGYIMA